MQSDFLSKVNFLTKSPSIYYSGFIKKPSKFLSFISIVSYLIILSTVGYIGYYYFGLKNRPYITRSQSLLEDDEKSLGNEIKLLIGIRNSTTEELLYIDRTEIDISYSQGSLFSCENKLFEVNAYYENLSKYAICFRNSDFTYSKSFNMNFKFNSAISAKEIQAKYSEIELFIHTEKRLIDEEQFADPIKLFHEFFTINMTSLFTEKKYNTYSLTENINDVDNMNKTDSTYSLVKQENSELLTYNLIALEEYTLNYLIHDIGFLWDILNLDTYADFYSQNSMLKLNDKFNDNFLSIQFSLRDFKIQTKRSTQTFPELFAQITGCYFGLMFCSWIVTFWYKEIDYYGKIIEEKFRVETFEQLYQDYEIKDIIRDISLKFGVNFIAKFNVEESEDSTVSEDSDSNKEDEDSEGLNNDEGNKEENDSSNKSKSDSDNSFSEDDENCSEVNKKSKKNNKSINSEQSRNNSINSNNNSISKIKKTNINKRNINHIIEEVNSSLSNESGNEDNDNNFFNNKSSHHAKSKNNSSVHKTSKSNKTNKTKKTHNDSNHNKKVMNSSKNTNNYNLATPAQLTKEETNIPLFNSNIQHIEKKSSITPQYKPSNFIDYYDINNNTNIHTNINNNIKNYNKNKSNILNFSYSNSSNNVNNINTSIILSSNNDNREMINEKNSKNSNKILNHDAGNNIIKNNTNNIKNTNNINTCIPDNQKSFALDSFDEEFIQKALVDNSDEFMSISQINQKYQTPSINDNNDINSNSNNQVINLMGCNTSKNPNSLSNSNLNRNSTLKSKSKKKNNRKSVTRFSNDTGNTAYSHLDISNLEPIAVESKVENIANNIKDDKNKKNYKENESNSQYNIHNFQDDKVIKDIELNDIDLELNNLNADANSYKKRRSKNKKLSDRANKHFRQKQKDKALSENDSASVSVGKKNQPTGYFSPQKNSIKSETYKKRIFNINDMKLMRKTNLSKSCQSINKSISKDKDKENENIKAKNHYKLSGFQLDKIRDKNNQVSHRSINSNNVNSNKKRNSNTNPENTNFAINKNESRHSIKKKHNSNSINNNKLKINKYNITKEQFLKKTTTLGPNYEVRKYIQDRFKFNLSILDYLNIYFCSCYCWTKSFQQRKYQYFFKAKAKIRELLDVNNLLLNSNSNAELMKILFDDYQRLIISKRLEKVSLIDNNNLDPEMNQILKEGYDKRVSFIKQKTTKNYVDERLLEYML